MKAGLKRFVFAAATLLLGAVSAFAQQATITGTVTDTSGGVLPGVTITIIHDETGNTFEAVTDAQGQFRIPVRVGAHRLTASLSGFQTSTRTGLQLLLSLAPVVQTGWLHAHAGLFATVWTSWRQMPSQAVWQQ